MMRRRRSRSSRGPRRGERLVSTPLIVVAALLFGVGLLGTVLPVAAMPVAHDIGVWSLICSNVLLFVGAFSREM